MLESWRTVESELEGKSSWINNSKIRGHHLLKLHCRNFGFSSKLRSPNSHPYNKEKLDKLTINNFFFNTSEN